MEYWAFRDGFSGTLRDPTMLVLFLFQLQLTCSILVSGVQHSD